MDGSLRLRDSAFSGGPSADAQPQRLARLCQTAAWLSLTLVVRDVAIGYHEGSKLMVGILYLDIISLRTCVPRNGLHVCVQTYSSCHG